MKVLITGRAGFIGSHRAERLLSEGHSVIIVDNLHAGSRNNIHHLLNDPDPDIVRHDVTPPFRIEGDQIYNLACPASPIHYQRLPARTVELKEGLPEVIEYFRPPAKVNSGPQKIPR